MNFVTCSSILYSYHQHYPLTIRMKECCDVLEVYSYWLIGVDAVWVPAPYGLPRAQCWVLCYTSCTPLRLAHSLLPLLCWVSCMPMTFRPTHTALLLVS